MQSTYRLLIFFIFIAIGGLFYKVIFPSTAVNSDKSDASVFFSKELIDSDLVNHPLSKLQGKILIVNFWATWCPPCREEIPDLSNLYLRHKNQGLEIIGISTDDITKTKEFLRTNQVSYPVLIGDIQSMAIAESLGNDKGALPFTVIIDAKGKIIQTFLGRIDLTTVENKLLPLFHTSIN